MRSALYRRTHMALCAVRRNRSGPLRFLFYVSGRIRVETGTGGNDASGEMRQRRQT